MIRKTRCAVVAALLCVAFAAPVLAKPLCYTPQDIKAMQVRQLHYELMVAALKCQGGEVDFRAKWSDWVDRFGNAMTTNASHLRGLFNRLGKGQSGLDRYVTQLSNNASMRAQYAEDYCGSRAQMFEAVLPLNASEMESWAVDRMDKPQQVSASCTAAPPPSAVKQAKATPAPAKDKAKTERAKAPVAAQNATPPQEKG